MWSIGRLSSETFWDKEDWFIISYSLVSILFWYGELLVDGGFYNYHWLPSYLNKASSKMLDKNLYFT